MASPSSNNIPPGFIAEQTAYGDWNKQHFQIQQLISKINTITIVRVEKCTNNGETSPVGFVDITPMINQIDASGNSTPHATIFNVPYSRLQGGSNAVIIDPVKGDIGIALFASRDISKVKSTKKQNPPGSRRQFSFSDAIYIGGLLNGAPNQYVRFSEEGIEINSPNQVKAVVGGNSITLNATKAEAVIGANSVLLNASQFLTTVLGQTLKLNTSGLYHNDVNIGSTHSHYDITNTTPFTGRPLSP